MRKTSSLAAASEDELSCVSADHKSALKVQQPAGRFRAALGLGSDANAKPGSTVPTAFSGASRNKDEASGTTSVWRAKKPSKRPSWLEVSKSHHGPTEDDTAAQRQQLTQSSSHLMDEESPAKTTKDSTAEAEDGNHVTAPSTGNNTSADAEDAQSPTEDDTSASTYSSERSSPFGETPGNPVNDLIARLRKNVGKPEGGQAYSKPATPRQKWTAMLGRLRGANATQDPTALRQESSMPGSQMPAKEARNSDNSHEEAVMPTLSPNDLRHYVTNRVANGAREERTQDLPKPSVGMGKVGPLCHGLDGVIAELMETTIGNVPRAVLVAGTSPRADAALASTLLGRVLACETEKVALLDIANGASVVSSRLRIPRVPGFSELSEGKAGFDEVIYLDAESDLQVITAGAPVARDARYGPDRFMQIFETLREVYDCVIIHADLSSMDALMPALKFELPAAVAVLPARGTIDTEGAALTTFQRLGCPIVVYGARQNPRRSWFFKRQGLMQ